MKRLHASAHGCALWPGSCTSTEQHCSYWTLCGRTAPITHYKTRVYGSFQEHISNQFLPGKKKTRLSIILRTWNSSTALFTELQYITHIRIAGAKHKLIKTHPFFQSENFFKKGLILKEPTCNASQNQALYVLQTCKTINNWISGHSFY